MGFGVGSRSMAILGSAAGVFWTGHGPGLGLMGLVGLSSKDHLLIGRFRRRCRIFHRDNDDDDD